MYVRVTRTVQDKGVLVRPEEVEFVVDDRDTDWYRSAFTYGEDAKEYWEDNDDSIQGYKGKAFTDTLYWDIDCKTDYEKAKKATVILYDKLTSLGLEKGIEVYFSGNKGFHLLLVTDSNFTNEETQTICTNLFVESGASAEVFDTAVYNITRIFRIANTRHQESGAYKIPVTYEEVKSLSKEEMFKLAANTRFEEFDTHKVEGSLLKKYATTTRTKKNKKESDKAQLLEFKVVKSEVEDLDLNTCPPGKRRCIFALENGYFGSGERHEAILRLAAYYKTHEGCSRKHAGDLIFEALRKREQRYVEATPIDEQECNRDIDEVFSEEWQGGMYTCKTDPYLASKCDHGKGPCYNDAKVRIKKVKDVNQLINTYIQYGEQALKDYPKFGIDWLDERVRLRPNNYSIIAGANGSGKTSLSIQLMENMNAQKMYHVFFSLDMSDSAMLEKLGAKYTNYSQKQIEKAFNVNTYNSDIVEEVKEALREHLPYTLFDFSSSVDLAYVEQTTQALKQVYPNLQMVIIDYVGRLGGPHENQYANATANANTANDVAKRLMCHLLLLSQVARENGDHTDALRTSRVSKDSGAWEENATVVLTVWRPFGSGMEGHDEYMHIYIAKNRSGELAENVFRWQGKSGIISEFETQYEFEEYCRLCEGHDLDVPKFNWFVKEIDPAIQEELVKNNPKFNESRKQTGLNFGKDVQDNVKEELPSSRSNGHKKHTAPPKRSGNV